MTAPIRFLSPAETATKLGVTVRALRLYERLGLVSPLRTAKGVGAGWRAYGPEQIARLHQVLALKRLGLPLARIGELLAGRLASLDAVLAVQEQALAARRDETDRALTALRAARARLAAGEALSMDDLTTLTQETTVTEKMTPEEWRETFEPLWTKHLSPQELEQLAARKDVGMRAFGDENGVSQAWDKLIAEAEMLRAKGDPGSPEAFNLVARWKVLQDAFTGGDPQIATKTAAMWKEALSDPKAAPKLPMGLGVWEFVAEASRRKREAEGG